MYILLKKMLILLNRVLVSKVYIKSCFIYITKELSIFQIHGKRIGSIPSILARNSESLF